MVEINDNVGKSKINSAKIILPSVGIEHGTSCVLISCLPDSANLVLFVALRHLGYYYSHVLFITV